MDQSSYTFPIESLLTHEQRVMAPLAQSELAFDAANIPITLHLLALVNKLNSRKMPSFSFDFSFPTQTEVGHPSMSFAYDKDLNKKGIYEMKIEVPKLYDISLDNNTVSFNLNHVSLTAGIFHVFHEYRHLQQYVDLKRVNPISKDTPEIAKVEAIRRIFPGYYLGENHDHHLIEMNAQIYAIKATIKYAKKYLPELDAEKLLLEANEARLLGMYMPGCTSAKELVAAWEKRKENPERCDLGDVTVFPYPISQKANQLLTPEFFNQYDSFKTAEEKDDFIYNALLKIHPSLRLSYPCLMNPRVFKLVSSLQFYKPVSTIRRQLKSSREKQSEKNTFSKYSMKKVYRHRE